MASLFVSPAALSTVPSDRFSDSGAFSAMNSPFGCAGASAAGGSSGLFGGSSSSKQMFGNPGERDVVMTVVEKHSDIIELNVGGRLLTTTRATLCANPDTLLAAMFSGRWSHDGGVTRDKHGVPFFDFDPDLFTLLLDHLRTLQLTPPPAQGSKAKPPALPRVPPPQRAAWDAMLGYLGFFSVVNIDVCSLSTFAKDTLHSKFELYNEDSALRMQSNANGGSSLFAAVAGGVERGSGVYVWRFKLRVPGSDTGFRIGVMEDAALTEKKLVGFPNLEEHQVSNKHAVFFIHSGEVRGPGGGYGSVKRKGDASSSWKEGREVTLQLDVSDANSPHFIVEHLSSCKVPLPKEWEAFRVLVGGWKQGQAWEIVSVEAQ